MKDELLPAMNFFFSPIFTLRRRRNCLICTPIIFAKHRIAVSIAAIASSMRGFLGRESLETNFFFLKFGQGRVCKNSAIHFRIRKTLQCVCNKTPTLIPRKYERPRDVGYIDRKILINESRRCCLYTKFTRPDWRRSKSFKLSQASYICIRICTSA